MSTELVIPTSITERHSDIASSFIESVRKMLDGVPTIKGYSVAADWRNTESLVLTIDPKTVLRIEIVRDN